MTMKLTLVTWNAYDRELTFAELAAFVDQARAMNVPDHAGVRIVYTPDLDSLYALEVDGPPADSVPSPKLVQVSGALMHRLVDIAFSVAEHDGDARHAVSSARQARDMVYETLTEQVFGPDEPLS